MYRYNDKVEIIDGFYSGLRGKLIGVNNDSMDAINNSTHSCRKYIVQIMVRKGTTRISPMIITVDVPETYLVRIK